MTTMTMRFLGVPPPTGDSIEILVVTPSPLDAGALTTPTAPPPPTEPFPAKGRALLNTLLPNLKTSPSESPSPSSSSLARIEALLQALVKRVESVESKLDEALSRCDERQTRDDNALRRCVR